MKAYQQRLLQKAKDWLGSVDDEIFLSEHQALTSKGVVSVAESKRLLTETTITGLEDGASVGDQSHGICIHKNTQLFKTCSKRSLIWYKRLM